MAAGDGLTLSLTFSATGGKIITVYTVGPPLGSLTCFDGAPSYSTNDTGLRATVAGTTAG